ncbi:protein of unknown function (plasmid) [Shinella sp. WSC3-e]|nr:protein of unknown function [Shinella sp. WSC3-e]
MCWAFHLTPYGPVGSLQPPRRRACGRDRAALKSTATSGRYVSIHLRAFRNMPDTGGSRQQPYAVLAGGAVDSRTTSA